MNEEVLGQAWWMAPLQLLIEALVGVFNFLVIAAAAVAINLVVHLLRKYDIDGAIIYGLTGAEYALFLMDLVLFGRHLWRTGARAWRAPR